MDATLISLIPAEELQRFTEGVTQSLMKFKENLENMKCQKWHRDVEDYKQGRIYNWQREGNTRGFMTTDPHKNGKGARVLQTQMHLIIALLF